MQFSAFGFMHADYTISFPSEILRPIGLGRRKMIHCMYYPERYSSITNSNGFNSFGFMMTPLPYADWPRTARFTIKLRDVVGAAHAVCKIINDECGTLGLVGGGATGYTYSTLNLSVTFNDLKLTVNSPYSKKNGYYIETYERASKLAERIKGECDDLLYSGEESIDLHTGKKLSKSNYQHRNSVVNTICTSLTYFWRLVELEDLDELKPFELKLGTNNRVIDDKRYIKSILSKKLEGSSEPHKIIGSRPIYASLDTKDQTIRFRIMPKDSESSIVGIRIYWETIAGKNSRGLLESITKYFLDKNWNMRQTFSKESSEGKQTYGLLNIVVEMQTIFEAEQFLDTKPEFIRKDLQRTLSKDHEIRQVRITQLTNMLASAWRRSDVGENKYRVNILISAPNKNYDEAKKLTKELNEMGYLAEFIHDLLEKGGPGKNTILSMADIIRKGSALLVIADENYGEYILQTLESGKVKVEKEGLYSEFEIAMALGAGIDVYPVAYERGEKVPNLPSESLLSPTSMFMRLDFKNDRENSILQIEDRYLELAGKINTFNDD